MSYKYIDWAVGREINRYMIEMQANIKIWAVLCYSFCLSGRTRSV